MISALALSLPLAFASVPAQTSWAPIPAGWVVASEDNEGQLPKRVLVRKGESAETSSSRIEEIRFPGFALLLKSEDTVDGARDRLLKACPEARREDLPKPDGKESSAALLECPLNPKTGKQLVVFMLAERVGTSIHTRAVAYKRAPTTEERHFALAYLGVPN